MDCFQGVSFSIRSNFQLKPFVFQLVHSLLGKSEPISIFQGKTTKKNTDPSILMARNSEHAFFPVSGCKTLLPINSHHVSVETSPICRENYFILAEPIPPTSMIVVIVVEKATKKFGSTPPTQKLVTTPPPWT